MKIKPTVGRVLLYTPHASSVYYPRQLAAIVTDVPESQDEFDYVNVAVFTPDAALFPALAVRLVQAGEENNLRGNFCEWMPYQLGQAAKTEAVIAEHEAQRGGDASDQEEASSPAKRDKHSKPKGTAS